VNDVRENFKSKYIRNGGEAAFLCDDCDQEEIQPQNQCLVCPKWDGIRQGLDVNTMEGLASFFQRLLMERAREKTGSQGAAQQDSYPQLVTD
jgi:predicted ATP-dependent serine protease